MDKMFENIFIFQFFSFDSFLTVLISFLFYALFQKYKNGRKFITKVNCGTNPSKIQQTIV